jgi:hypothetical protein
LSIDAFVKRFATSGLSEPLYFYRDASGVPQITLKFDKEKWIYYLVREDGSLEKQWGVTGTCHVIDKSDALMPWACKMMDEMLRRTMPTRTRADDVLVTVELPFTDFEALTKEAKSAHKNRVEDAAEVGHIAHDCIEQSIKRAIESNSGIVTEWVNFPTDERAASSCEAALKWMQAHNVRWKATERKVYSRKYKVAGTLDGLCLVDSCSDYLCCPGTKERPAFKDRLTVADWKTANGLYPEFCYQTAIYQFAVQEEDGITVEDRWILRLDKEDATFEPWHLTADCYEADLHGFLSCLQLVQAHDAVTKRISAMKKLRTAAKRAAKADVKRLAKDNERVAKALAKAAKKAEREAEKATEKQRVKDVRDAERLAKRIEKKPAVAPRFIAKPAAIMSPELANALKLLQGEATA